MKAILIVGAILAASHLPTSQNEIIGYCDALGHMTAELAVARAGGVEKEQLAQTLIQIAQDRNRDDNDYNDITIEQEKIARKALDYAYLHKELSPSQVFDTIYTQCKKDNRTLVNDGETS